MRDASRNEPPGEEFVRFLRGLAPSARRPARPPATIEGWDQRLAEVKTGLKRSFGRTPEEEAPLDPEILGTIERDGYAVDRLTFQSRPGVRVTANVYRPVPSTGRVPAVLSVHGHSPWARIDPGNQPRCIALARMGYVVLAVDAFGAGERAPVPAPGTYHGALLGASLWPVGTPLIGLQVYDNRRAVDYLISRDDVDAGRLAVTGASGGGNQSLYAGATDDRFKAVVPVCGVGTYESYLTTACCVCEVNVGGLTYALTGDLLAMTAPRALMVISATRDSLQFSVGEARKSADYARERYRLLGRPDNLRHVAVEAGHSYNQPMREALYGWLDKHLRDRGEGSPIPEPELKIEDPETLRCYRDAESRPKTIVTIPQFARSQGQARLAALPAVPDHRERWNAESIRISNRIRERIFNDHPPALRDTVLGGSSPGMRFNLTATPGPGRIDHLAFSPERGLTNKGRIVATGEAGTALFVGGRQNGGETPKVDEKSSRLQGALEKAKFGWIELDLRGVGAEKPATPAIHGVADHNEAEWALWVGRPLLGQWVTDIIRWMTALDEARLADGRLPSDRPFPRRPYILAADGPLSLAAILAAALDSRVEAVLVSGCPISFVADSDRPWSKLPMGVIVPNILEAADVAQMAGLIAPRQLVIADGVVPEGDAAAAERLRSAFAWTRDVYRLLGAEKNLTLGSEGPVVPKFPVYSHDRAARRDG